MPFVLAFNPRKVPRKLFLHRVLKRGVAIAQTQPDVSTFFALILLEIPKYFPSSRNAKREREKTTATVWFEISPPNSFTSPSLGKKENPPQKCNQEKVRTKQSPLSPPSKWDHPGWAFFTISRSNSECVLGQKKGEQGGPTHLPLTSLREILLSTKFAQKNKGQKPFVFFRKMKI